MPIHQNRSGQFADHPAILGATDAAGVKIYFQPTVEDATANALEYARSVAEVEGREAELVLSPSAVEDIWDKGHPAPAVMFTRGKWFWVVDLLRQYPTQEFFEFDPHRLPDEYMRQNPFVFEAGLGKQAGQFRTSALELRRGLQLLNT